VEVGGPPVVVPPVDPPPPPPPPPPVPDVGLPFFVVGVGGGSV